MLLVGAGLLVRSLLRLQRVNPGFRTENALTLSLRLANYASDSLEAAFYTELTERLRALPGVTGQPSVGAAVGWRRLLSRSRLPRRRPARTASRHEVGGPWNVIRARLLRDDGTHLLRGREFTRQDGANTTPVAIVNEEFVRRMFPGKTRSANGSDHGGTKTCCARSSVWSATSATLAQTMKRAPSCTYRTRRIPGQRCPSLSGPHGTRSALLPGSAPAPSSLDPNIAVATVDAGRTRTTVRSRRRASTRFCSRCLPASRFCWRLSGFDAGCSPTASRRGCARLACGWRWERGGMT